MDDQPTHAAPPGQPEPEPGGESERERELAALAAIQNDLADVDRALARLDDGSYGACEVCGQAIPDDVLERAPATRLCAAHEAAPAAGVANVRSGREP